MGLRTIKEAVLGASTVQVGGKELLSTASQVEETVWTKAGR